MASLSFCLSPLENGLAAGSKSAIVQGLAFFFLSSGLVVGGCQRAATLAFDFESVLSGEVVMVQVIQFEGLRRRLCGVDAA